MFRRLAVGVLALGLIWPAMVSGEATAMRAVAPTLTTCSFAATPPPPNSGAYLRTLCWIDMSGYSDTLAQSAPGQLMSVTLPGGDVASFTINSDLPTVATFPSIGTPTQGAVCAKAFPTFNGAALGNGWYDGLPAGFKPALLQNHGACGGSGNEARVTLSGITVTAPGNVPITNYGFVMANAEATGTDEENIYTSSTPLSLLEEAGSQTNADCFSTLVQVNANTISCGYPAASPGGAGNPIFQSIAPSSVSATMITQGGEAVAFGFLVANVELTKTVTARAAASDSFDLSIANGTTTLSGPTTTGTANTADTGSVTVLTAGAGVPITLSEAGTPGSATDLSRYSQSWSCSNAAAASTTTLPPANGGTSQTVQPLPGDDITCAITNSTPEQLTVTKTGAGSGTVTETIGGTAGAINCGSTCTDTQLSGTPVTLTESPATGSTFTGWTGCTSNPTPTTCITTLAAATTITANFVPVPETLTVTTNGTGTVTSSDGAINCGTTCTATDPFGTAVTLTASPGPGQTFTGWTGCTRNPTPTTCVTTLVGATAVTATFVPTPVPPQQAPVVQHHHHPNCNNDPNSWYAGNPAFCPAIRPTD